MPFPIRAAVLRELNAPVTIEKMELDDPAPDEVLLEVKAAGICHSDLHYIDGSIPRPLPLVLGHEAAGVVIAVGSNVSSLSVGDHVIPLFCPECGECENCRSGKTNVCKHFGAHNNAPRIFQNGEPIYRASLGTFASHALVPEIAVTKVRKDAPFDRVFYCGCGVTTGVGAVMFDAKVNAGEKVVVFGAGGIGLNVIQGARLAGAGMIVAVDANPAREADARQFGATEFVNPKEISGKLSEALLALTAGGADHCFECIGNVQVMKEAVDATNPFWGRCTIVGIAGHDQVLEVNAVGMMMGRSVKGSLFGGAKGRTDVPKVIDWYMDQKINLDDLITHKISLDEVNHGLDLLRNGESIRTVMIP